MQKLTVKTAFSLVEVLIFVTIITSFFVIAVGLTSQSIQQMKSSENRLIAGYLSQEILEWLRGEKETDWSGQFLQKAPAGGPATYCFNTSPIQNWPSAGACSGYTLRTIFMREVVLTRQALPRPDQYQVNVTITTSWQDAGRVQSSVQKTVFNALE